MHRALEHLERAASLDPNNADAHYDLGVLFVSREQTQLAAQHYQIAAILGVDSAVRCAAAVGAA